MAVHIKPNLAYRKIDGQVFIVDAGNEILHSLNETGTAIWEMLDKKRDPDGIAEILSREFNATPEIIKKDVEEFLRELSAKGLVIMERRND